MWQVHFFYQTESSIPTLQRRYTHVFMTLEPYGVFLMCKLLFGCKQVSYSRRWLHFAVLSRLFMRTGNLIGVIQFASRKHRTTKSSFNPFATR